MQVQVLPDLASDCSGVRNNSGGATISIDEALANPGSNTTLRLQDGCYLVNNFTLLQGLSDISLIGSGRDTTILKCLNDSEVGLAFVNISGLVFSDLTITGCSLSANGVNLRQAFNAINQALNLFYGIAANTTVGIFIGDTSDLHLHNMVVQNTTGIGMVAINLMGTSDMSNVTFRRNAPQLCQASLYNSLQPTVGGGLYILYADYHNLPSTISTSKLTISSSLFTSNSQCNPVVSALPLSRESTNNETQYQIGSGGGLGLTLSQVKYSVDINIVSTIFENNIALYGGGACIIYHRGVNNSIVNISGSVFQRNGVGVDNFMINQLYTTAGGLAVLLNVGFPRNHALLQDVTPPQIQSSTVLLENTNITENEAIVLAGASVVSFDSPLTTRRNQNNVMFKRCRISGNISPSAAAFGAQSVEFSGSNSGVNTVFEDVIIEENDVSSFNSTTILLAGATGRRSVATLSSINLIIRGQSRFFNNRGSALQLTRSIVTIDGDVSFSQNRGSAIILLDTSYIVLLRNSKLSFIGNIAKDAGGAILVDLASSATDTSVINDCFLWFGDLNTLCRYHGTCQDPNQLNATLVFDNNQAPLGGTIYGSRLSTCPWAVYPNGTIPPSGIAILEQFPTVTFNPSPNNTAVISTDPFVLIIENSSEPILAVPGRPVNLSVIAVDLFNQSVPTAITSSQREYARLGLSGFWFLSGLNPNPSVQATFFGEPESQINTTINVVDSFASKTLQITLQDCTFGFVLTDNKECACNQDLPSVVDCSQETYQIQVPPSFWLGNSPTGGIAYASCVFDYCDVGTKTISDGDIDSQCQSGFNLAGLMCAACQPNTSVVFGSSACRTCSNDWLALIILFAVIGILLVIAISFLGFSISEGYLNSLLFYCNVTSFYASFFAPNMSIGFILVRFVNLSLGFELCFYDGMDTLGKVGIQLLFPAYLFLIMIVIIILATLSSKISNAGFSAAKTFSTLLLLCYTSVGETCVRILGLQTLSGTNGTYYGWYTDPTVQYGNGFHGFLVFVAVALILLYILPFSIALLLPPLILRTKLSIMLKPLLDAFWNPFKPTFRFWLGFRAILRIIPFFFAVFTPYPTNCFLLIVFLMALLILHERCQPFEGKWQNILDELFMTNLLLLSAGAVFFGLTTPNSDTHIAFVSILLILTYFAFLVIITVHINIRFPVIREKIMHLVQKLKEKLQKKDENTFVDEGDPIIQKISSEENDGKAGLSTTYAELREPILAYGEGDYL